MLCHQVENCKGVFKLPYPGGLLIVLFFLLSSPSGVLWGRWWHLLLPQASQSLVWSAVLPALMAERRASLRSLSLRGSAPLAQMTRLSEYSTSRGVPGNAYKKRSEKKVVSVVVGNLHYPSSTHGGLRSWCSCGSHPLPPQIGGNS